MKTNPSKDEPREGSKHPVDPGNVRVDTSGVLRTVYKNSVLNVVTQVFVLAVTFVSIPQILHGLGDTYFGVLSIVLVFIGYFSLMDFGVGRAVVKFVADKRSNGDLASIATIFTFSSVFGVVVGVVVGTLIYLLAPQLATLLFKVPDGMGVVVASIKIVAITMPFMILQGILKGVLMGYERFDLSNLLQAANGIFQWGGILALVLLHADLISIVWYVAILRMAITALHFFVAMKVSGLKGMGSFSNVGIIKGLLSFGGWVMVSQALGPVLQYLERFVLSATIATSILPYYVIPFEAASKILVFATAIGSALFPGLSGIGGLTDSSDKFRRVYKISVKLLIYVMIPTGIILITFGQEILKVWIGTAFASKSLLCFQLLIIAFVMNSVAQIPYTSLHALGKPNLTGIFHMIELPIHIFVVFTLVGIWGVLGAAAATLVRMGLDMTLLFSASHKQMKIEKIVSGRRVSALVAPFLIASCWFIVAFFFAEGMATRVLATVAGSALYILVIARISLDRKERAAVTELLLRRR